MVSAYSSNENTLLTLTVISAVDNCSKKVAVKQVFGCPWPTHESHTEYYGAKIIINMPTINVRPII